MTYRADPVALSLGDGFFDPVDAANFPETILRYRNDRAAKDVGLDHLSEDEWISHFARFTPLADNLPQPMAQRYHGHQFRHYNSELGDGRGFLFAQMRDGDGRLIDLTTKGSGTTPYSRRGDGRLTLKGGVREIMATEMLEAIGVNTSKTLSIIETGEKLIRGDEPSPTRSAVMVRQCHGSIRIGTFQRHAYFRDHERLEKLIDYAMEQFFGGKADGDLAERALAFLDKVVTTTANNAADLMAAGFVHGVLNSDNINITGEIFDFGPWRFLPTMDLMFTAAYFDETGLYSFGRQAEAIHWDVYQLGGCLVELSSEEAVREVLKPWGDRYSEALRQRLLRRLGLKSTSLEADEALLMAINDFLVATKAPYEQFFFDWYGGPFAKYRAEASPIADLYTHATAVPLKALLDQAAPISDAAGTHSYFSGKPCTMLYDEVEDIWAAIADRDDWSKLDKKLQEIAVMRDALAV